MITTVRLNTSTLHALRENDVTCRHVQGRNIQFDAVPVGPAFTKARTNLLFNGHQYSGPWQVFVDDDLQYSGDDVNRRRMMCGPVESRWRRLVPQGSCNGNIETTFRRVLGWLDSPLCQTLMAADQTASETTDADEFAGFGRSLRRAELVPDYVVAWSEQTEAVAQLVQTLLRTDGPRASVLVGDSGCGKTTTARMAAAEALDAGVIQSVVELDGAAICSGAIFGPERDERLRQALSVASEGGQRLMIVERFDLLLANSAVASALLAGAIDRGTKLVLVAQSQFEFADLWRDPALCRRLSPIRTGEPGVQELMEIVRERINQHSACDKCVVAEEIVHVIVSSCAQLEQAIPAAAIAVLETTLSRAAWMGSTHVGPDDVYFAIGQYQSSTDL